MKSPRAARARRAPRRTPKRPRTKQALLAELQAVILSLADRLEAIALEVRR